MEKERYSNEIISTVENEIAAKCFTTNRLDMKRVTSIYNTIQLSSK